MFRGKIKQGAANVKGGSAGAARRSAIGAGPVRWLTRSVPGQGKIFRRSLGVKRWGAQARIAAIRKRSRLVEQMCGLAWKQPETEGRDGAARSINSKMPLLPALLKPEAFRQNNTIAARADRFRAARTTGPQYWIALPQPTDAATEAPVQIEGAIAWSAAPVARVFLQPEEPMEWTVADDHDLLADSAAAAGAVGSLFTEANEGDLAFLMRLIAQGETAMASRLARRILGSKIAPEKPAPVPVKATRTRKALSSDPDRSRRLLSPREIKVLRMISQGLSNRQIAETSHRSLHMVDTQVKNIFRKLTVKSRAQAVREGMQKGLLEPETCG